MPPADISPVSQAASALTAPTLAPARAAAPQAARASEPAATPAPAGFTDPCTHLARAQAQLEAVEEPTEGERADWDNAGQIVKASGAKPE